MKQPESSADPDHLVGDASSRSHPGEKGGGGYLQLTPEGPRPGLHSAPSRVQDSRPDRTDQADPHRLVYDKVCQLIRVFGLDSEHHFAKRQVQPTRGFRHSWTGSGRDRSSCGRRREAEMLQLFHSNGEVSKTRGKQLKAFGKRGLERVAITKPRLQCK